MSRPGRLRAAGLAMVVFVLGGAATPAQDRAAPPATVTLPPALARVLTDYQAAWSARDAAALARLFDEEGFVLPNGHPPVQGRAAIEQFYEGHGGPLSLRAFAFGAEGDIAFILGGYATESGTPDIGKFTLALRKRGGRWLIVSDMDSGNQRR